jgi:hypothetical protein
VISPLSVILERIGNVLVDVLQHCAKVSLSATFR